MSESSTAVAYALSFGSLLLLGGRLADLFGRKRAFLVGLAGFAIVSAIGGAATSIEMLLVARAAQGVFGAIGGGGAAIGLLLGGVLTEYLDWRWSMYVNIIFAVIAFAGSAVLLIAFVFIQQRAEHPLLPLRVLLDRDRGGSIGTALLSTLAGNAVTSFMAGKAPSPQLMAEASVHSYTTAFVWAGWIFVAGAVICGPLIRSGAQASAASSTSDAPVAVHM